MPTSKLQWSVLIPVDEWPYARPTQHYGPVPIKRTTIYRNMIRLYVSDESDAKILRKLIRQNTTARAFTHTARK